MEQNNWQTHLAKSKEDFKRANHLAYVTLTLLKENRLLVKILVDLHSSLTNLIKAFLYYEKERRLVRLSNKPIENLNTFLQKIAPKYLEKAEIKLIIRILKIARVHKDAPLEFVRKEKFVMFNEGRVETLTSDVIKTYITQVSKIISKFPRKD